MSLSANNMTPGIDEILYDKAPDLTDREHIILRQALNHLISRRVREARIDELERIEFQPFAPRCMGCHYYTTGISDRIKALKEEGTS